jgi:hypothetical protein
MRNKKLFIKLLRAYRRGFEKGIDYGRNNKIPSEPTEFVVEPRVNICKVRQRKCFLNVIQCTSAINIDNNVIFEYGKHYYCESIRYGDGFVVYWRRLNVLFDEVDLMNYFRPIRPFKIRNEQ